MPTGPIEAAPQEQLVLHNLSFGYPGGALLASRVELTFERGGLYQLSGPSGCGKSTLLRLLVGLQAPRGGQICYQGRDINRLPPQTLRRKLLLVPQRPIMREGSVRENIFFPFDFACHRHRRRPSPAQALAYMHSLQLECKLNSPASQLSVGEAQRLALVRALLLSPPVLLLDEPTAALDLSAAQATWKLLGHWQQEQQSIIITVNHHLLPPGQAKTISFTTTGRLAHGDN